MGSRVIKATFSPIIYYPERWITVAENTDEIIKLLEDNNVPDGVVVEYFNIAPFI